MLIFLIICIIIGFSYDNKQKKDNDKMWEEYSLEYNNLWNNDSSHECSLKNVDGYIVTETNINEFKDSKITVRISDNFLYVQSRNSNKEVQYNLVKDIKSIYTHNEYKMGNDIIQPFITSLLDIRIWKKDKGYFNVYNYFCKKM